MGRMTSISGGCPKSSPDAWNKLDWIEKHVSQGTRVNQTVCRSMIGQVNDTIDALLDYASHMIQTNDAIAAHAAQTAYDMLVRLSEIANKGYEETEPETHKRHMRTNRARAILYPYYH